MTKKVHSLEENKLDLCGLEVYEDILAFRDSKPVAERDFFVEFLDIKIKFQ